jgi:predicted dehydrogenase
MNSKPGNRLKVAVIGAGVMGKHHANIYAAIPHLDLVAVVDPDEKRCAEARRNYDVRTYKTIDELLFSEPVDAVSIASPTSFHYAQSKQLLQAGVHVLVEKPVATEIEQAKELMELSRDLDLVLQVGHITRFYQAVSVLKRQVRHPYLIEARRLSPYARIKDVGVILDLMIHDIDIVLGLVRSPVKDVTVAGHLLNGSPFEDVAAAQITFENGCIARFLASRVAPDAERTLVIAEPTQTLRLDFAKEPHTEIAIYKPIHDDYGNSHVRVDVRTVHEDNPLKKELEHFLARIRNDAPPIGTLEDDLRSLTLATRLLEQLQPTRQPQLV